MTAKVCDLVTTPGSITLHVYVPAWSAASGLNVSVFMWPVVVIISGRTGLFNGSSQMMIG